MSSTIIYHMVAMTVPPELTGSDQPVVLIAAQMGESNCYESHSGRRSRSWQALHFGTRDQVLTDAIQMAGGFEGGGLKLGGASRWVEPETYIRRAKRLLKEADAVRATEPVPYGGGLVFAGIAPREAWDKPRQPIAWDDHERVRTFMAATLGCEKAPRAYSLFNVSGPEMR